MTSIDNSPVEGLALAAPIVLCPASEERDCVQCSLNAQDRAEPDSFREWFELYRWCSDVSTLLPSIELPRISSSAKREICL